MKWFLIFLMAFFSVSSFSEEDYSKYGMGLVIPKNWQKTAKFVSAKEAKLTALPATFDWRTVKTLSPIKSQGSCGSCWAFSSAETFRDAMIVQAGEQGDAAEQFLLDCNNKGYGCNGGFFEINDMFISPGSVREANYPYRGVQGQCKSTTPFTQAKSWAYVPTSSNGSPSVEEIKAAIYKYGPVSVGVAANEFSSYRGGVFCGTSQQLNHAVQLVGWGTDHWILRNSWGTGWGEQGFMRIKFGCNGVGEAANYFVYSNTPVPPPGPEPTPPGPVPPPAKDSRLPSLLYVSPNVVFPLGVKTVTGERYQWYYNGNPINKVAMIWAKTSKDSVYKLVITTNKKSKLRAVSESTTEVKITQ